jgi:hypothetical protein
MWAAGWHSSLWQKSHTTRFAGESACATSMDQLFAAPSGAGFSLPRLLPQADSRPVVWAVDGLSANSGPIADAGLSLGVCLRQLVHAEHFAPTERQQLASDGSGAIEAAGYRTDNDKRRVRGEPRGGA